VAQEQVGQVDIADLCGPHQDRFAAIRAFAGPSPQRLQQSLDNPHSIAVVYAFLVSRIWICPGVQQSFCAHSIPRAGSLQQVSRTSGTLAFTPHSN
jgi:hypothetical protein